MTNIKNNSLENIQSARLNFLYISKELPTLHQWEDNYKYKLNINSFIVWMMTMLDILYVETNAAQATFMFINHT